jgi:hypothetical protein
MFMKTIYGFLLVSILAGHKLTNQSHGQIYHVAGEAVFRSFYENEQPAWQRASRFAVASNDRQWWIRITPENTEVTDYYMICCDGIDTYSYEMLETGVRLRAQRGEYVASNIAAGHIRRGNLPRHRGAHEAGALWLAFASAYYLNKESSGYLEPAATLNVNSGNDLEPYQILRQKTTVSRFKQKPFLPSEVVYYDDGRYRIPGSDSPHATIQFPPPYQKGFTNTVYRVITATNVAGLTVPLRAEMTTYVPKRDGTHSTHLRMIAQYEILTTNVTELGSWNMDCRELPGVTFVHDYRFAEVLSPVYAVTYFCTNSFPAEEEVKQYPQFTQALAEARDVFGEVRPPHHFGRLFVIISFAFGVIGITLYVWRMRSVRET